MVIKLQMFKNVWLVLWVKDTVWWERSSIGYQWRVRTGRAQLEQETGNTHTRTPARQDLNFKKDPDTFGRASAGARLSTGAHLKQQGWMTESQRFSIHKTRAVWDTQSERARQKTDAQLDRQKARDTAVFPLHCQSARWQHTADKTLWHETRRTLLFVPLCPSATLTEMWEIPAKC